jgi:hypothetical protein
MARLPGEPDSLSFFSTAYNSGLAQLPKNICASRGDDPKNEAFGKFEKDWTKPLSIKSRK